MNILHKVDSLSLNIEMENSNNRSVEKGKKKIAS